MKNKPASLLVSLLWSLSINTRLKTKLPINNDERSEEFPITHLQINFIFIQISRFVLKIFNPLFESRSLADRLFLLNLEVIGQVSGQCLLTFPPSPTFSLSRKLSRSVVILLTSAIALSLSPSTRRKIACAVSEARGECGERTYSLLNLCSSSFVCKNKRFQGKHLGRSGSWPWSRKHRLQVRFNSPSWSRYCNDAWNGRCGNCKLRLNLKHSSALNHRETQCRQLRATAAMFLWSCVAQTLSRGDGCRHSLHVSVKYREYNENLMVLRYVCVFLPLPPMAPTPFSNPILPVHRANWFCLSPSSELWHWSEFPPCGARTCSALIGAHLARGVSDHMIGSIRFPNNQSKLRQISQKIQKYLAETLRWLKLRQEVEGSISGLVKSETVFSTLRCFFGAVLSKFYKPITLTLTRWIPSLVSRFGVIPRVWWRIKEFKADTSFGRDVRVLAIKEYIHPPKYINVE